MSFARVPLFGIALLTLFVGAAPARADLIAWKYNWSRSPGVINADSPGTGYITLTDESLHTAVGDSDIVATNLRTYSTASPQTPDVFTAKPYTLSLFLQDQASGISGTLTFTGQFDGKISSLNSNITNTFTGLTTQQLVLGNNLYTARIDSYAPPGPTNSSNSGSISAHATVDVETIIQDVPEPNGLLLACLAAPAAGFVLWRRRKLSLRAGMVP
jgi:hypothetical protein